MTRSTRLPLFVMLAVCLLAAACVQPPAPKESGAAQTDTRDVFVRLDFDDAQARVHRAPGIVFMGRGVTKIDQQAIAEVLGNMALILLDDLGRSLLILIEAPSPSRPLW